MTTPDEIRQWLKRGKDEGATHIIIVCDTFDHSDYPAFIREGVDVRAEMKGIDSSNMQRIMEVYNLDLNIEEQLAEKRAWHTEYTHAQAVQHGGGLPAGRVVSVSAGPGSQVQVGEDISGDQTMEKPRPEHPPWSKSNKPLDLVMRTEFAKFCITWRADHRADAPTPMPMVSRKTTMGSQANDGFTHVPFQLLDQYMYWRMADLGYHVIDGEGNEVQEGSKKISIGACGHSACRQNWCDTGETLCLQNEDEVDALEELRKELTESGHGTEVTDPDNYEETIRTAAGVVSDHRKLRDEVEAVRLELDQFAMRTYSEMSTAAHESQAAIVNMAGQLQKATDDS